MITHIVTFKLHDPAEAERCKTDARWPLRHGPVAADHDRRHNVVESPRAHTLGLIATFDDLAGLEAYQVHSAHSEVASHLRAASSAIAAVDFRSA